MKRWHRRSRIGRRRKFFIEEELRETTEEHKMYAFLEDGELFGASSAGQSLAF